MKPYEPPSRVKMIHVPPNDVYATVPVTRGPLLAVENEADGYILECTAMALFSTPVYMEYAHPVLEWPHFIFGDLKRQNEQESHCYTGCPKDYQDKKGNLCSWPTNHVILAFAKFDEASKKIIITRLAWRPEDPKKQGCPAHWDSDFGVELWKR